MSLIQFCLQKKTGTWKTFVYSLTRKFRTNQKKNYILETTLKGSSLAFYKHRVATILARFLDTNSNQTSDFQRKPIQKC